MTTERPSTYAIAEVCLPDGLKGFGPEVHPNIAPGLNRVPSYVWFHRAKKIVRKLRRRSPRQRYEEKHAEATPTANQSAEFHPHNSES